MPFFDIVVAHSKNHVIGVSNTIPWTSKRELGIFKKITSQGNEKNIIIMGRNTWDSLPVKPLPNRHHIIISTTLQDESLTLPQSVHVVSSFEKALEHVSHYQYQDAHVFVIGGESIYKIAIQSPWCRYIYETTIDIIIPEDGTLVKYMPKLHEYPYAKIYESNTISDKNNNLSFHVTIWKRKIPILWWIDTSCYEYDWIIDKLSNIPSMLIENKTSCPTPNAVIIANELISKQDLLEEYDKYSIPYSLIHLSDEYLDDIYTSYQSSSCKQIFRNYYHPQFDNDNHSKILTFGIGPKADFWKNIEITNIDTLIKTPFDKRPYQWSFAGYLKKSDRLLICNLFTSFQPYFVHETQGFHCGILDTETYRDILLQSKFVLCPIGNCSLDTFRIYEACEAGAIPVTLYSNVNQPFIRHVRNYWEHIFGKNKTLPWVVNSSWEQNVQMVKYLLNNPHIYHRIQHELIHFWKEYKLILKNTFTDILWNRTSISKNHIAELLDVPLDTIKTDF